MGQLISANHTDNSNDELINTLVKREYIQTINVEKVFRSVDRGLYYTKDSKLNAYRDSAWQSGDVHLSAPSVYATVLECLDLHKGHAFLNIGSGIGYFSTLAGLLLGVNGVNHGIEIRGSSIDIAYQKLEEFKQKSAAIDYFEFCEPVFIEGNACELLSVGYYDRVYCGAGVPPAESSFMKSLIKIGGVLVMPLEGFLVKAIRTGEYSWKTIQVLEVSFADLVVPEKCSSMKVSKFPTVEPLSLQELCRSSIRASIRNCLNQSYPGLQIRTKCKSTKLDDQKFYDHDPLSQFVRLEYGTVDGEMINIRNIADTLAVLNNSMSDLSSTSDNEAIEEDNDNNNSGDDDDDDDDDEEEEEEEEDDDDYVVEEENYNSNSSSDDEDEDDDDEENTSEQCDKSLLKKTESDTKRKSSEAECSEQNKVLPEKTENTKRMRMNTSPSTVTNLLNSQSTNSSGDIWGTMFGDLSEPDDDDDDDHIDSDSWVSSENDNSDDFGEIYNSLFNGEDIDDSDDSDGSDTDSEVARELILYRFLSERKENELSKLLKVKIDLLPVPTTLKLFLNYNKKE